MAGPVPSISRRRILGAAASLPVLGMWGQLHATVPDSTSERRAWERKLARYRRLAAEAEEAAATGWFAAASARYHRERAAIAARFGSWEAAGACAEGRRARAEAFGPDEAAEQLYWERCTAPMQQAAVALALAPAPDLAAVRAKIAAMRAHELESLGSMPRHPLELIDEDLGRIMAA